VVRNPVDCSPCRKRVCHVPGHPCMTGLLTDPVLARARARLGLRPGATLAH